MMSNRHYLRGLIINLTLYYPNRTSVILHRLAFDAGKMYCDNHYPPQILHRIIFFCIFLQIWCKTYRNVMVWTMITGGWIWSLGMASLPLFGWGVYLPESNGMRFDRFFLKRIYHYKDFHDGIKLG